MPASRTGARRALAYAVMCFALLCMCWAQGTPPANSNYCQADVAYPAATPPAGYRLRQVQIIHRHGDRTPTTGPFYINDSVVWDCSLQEFEFPTEDDTSVTGNVPRLYRKQYLPGRELLPGNCNFGQLTSKGLQQHMALGSLYRRIYIDQYKFLPQELDTNLIWTRSTDVYRTFQSLQANLLGLYPVNSRPTNVVPVIDVFTMDSENENLYPNTALCPRLAQLNRKLIESPAYVDFLTTQSRTVQKQVAALGYFGGAPDDVNIQTFCDTCWARTCHGFPLPPGVTQQLFQQAWQADVFSANYINGNETTSLWSIGSFAAELVQRMNDLMSGNSNATQAKMLYYSGHDTTILPLMHALLVSDNQWPPYASHVEFELWSDTANAFYVKISYNGQLKQLAGCSSVFCPYAQFLAAVKRFLPTNYAAQCAPQ